MRCVAEDEDAFRRKLYAVLFRRAAAGEVAELIAVVVVVGVGPEFEIMPHAVVREFQFRAALEIAGE